MSKMQSNAQFKVRTTGLFLLFVMLLSWVEILHAESTAQFNPTAQICQTFLSKVASASNSVLRWARDKTTFVFKSPENELREARAENNVKKGAHALRRLLRKNAKTLNLSQSERYFLAAHQLLLPGPKTPGEWLKSGLMNGVLPIAFSLSPQLYYQLGRTAFFLRIDSRSRDSLMMKLPFLEEKLGISGDEFISNVNSQFSSELRAYRRRMIGSAIKQSLASFLIGTTLLASPYIVQETLDHGPDYIEQDYYDDIVANADVTFSNKKVVVLVDAALAREAGYLRLGTLEDSTGVTRGSLAMANMKKMAAEVTTVLIKDYHDLDRSFDLPSVRDADVIIITEHGLAQKSFIGKQEIFAHTSEFRPHVFTKNPTFIFDSCLVGNVCTDYDSRQNYSHPREEKWVKFIDRIRGGSPVKAIASLRVIVQEFTSEGISASGAEASSNIVNTVSKNFLPKTKESILIGIGYRYLFPQKPYQFHFEYQNELGFREYNSNSGEVGTFIRPPDAKNKR